MQRSQIGSIFAFNGDQIINNLKIQLTKIKAFEVHYSKMAHTVIQSIGIIPPQMSDAYIYLYDEFNSKKSVLLYLNYFLVNNSDTFLIISPRLIEYENQSTYYIFNKQVRSKYVVSQRVIVSEEQFKSVFCFNLLIFGDCYQTNTKNDLCQKSRPLESFLEPQQQFNTQLNILVAPVLADDQIDFSLIYNFIGYKFSNTQYRFTYQPHCLVSSESPFRQMVVIAQIENPKDTLLSEFFTHLLNLNYFTTFDEVHRYFDEAELTQSLYDYLTKADQQTKLPSVQKCRKRNSLDDSSIIICASLMHISQFHEDSNGFNNYCSKCESGGCSFLDIKPVTWNFYQAKDLVACPIRLEFYELVAAIFQALVCHLKKMCYIQLANNKFQRLIPLRSLEYAIATPSFDAERNYENLETLGDTVLKYVVSAQLYNRPNKYSENEMTHKRSKIISNQSLCEIYQKLALLTLNQKIHFKKIRNHLRHTLNQESDFELSPKQQADIYEGLLGAAFEKNFSLQDAIRFLKMTGFPVELDKCRLQEGLTKIQFQKTDQILEYPLIEMARKKPFEISFNKPLTEFPIPLKGISEAYLDYERLEFLGDAALELLVVTNIYHEARKLFYNEQFQYECRLQNNFKNLLCPGMLHSAKIILLDSGFMGVMALHHGYHKYLKVNFEQQQQLTKILISLNEETFENFLDIQDYGKILPKYLSDIWESVAACVLIERGWQGLMEMYGDFYRPFISYVAKNLPSIYQKFQDRNRNIQKSKQI